MHDIAGFLKEMELKLHVRVLLVLASSRVPGLSSLRDDGKASCWHFRPCIKESAGLEK